MTLGLHGSTKVKDSWLFESFRLVQPKEFSSLCSLYGYVCIVPNPMKTKPQMKDHISVHQDAGRCRSEVCCDAIFKTLMNGLNFHAWQIFAQWIKGYSSLSLLFYQEEIEAKHEVIGSRMGKLMNDNLGLTPNQEFKFRDFE